MERMLEHMTWRDVERALSAGCRTVIIPVGSVEQHGYHLPLDTDAVLGAQAARALAERLGDALVAPAIRPGLSEHHMSMPGTVTLREETLKMLVEDYLSAYERHGFRLAVVMASHGGNVRACKDVAERWTGEMRVIAVQEVPANAELDAETEELGLPEGSNGGHADDRETSEMLLADAEHVHMERATRGFTGKMGEAELAAFFGRGVRALTDVGAVGDPTRADAQRGAWYVKRTVERMERALKARLAKEARR